MIRIDRGDEPDHLKAIRDRHLKRLRKWIEDEGQYPPSKQIHGYSEVRDDLYQVQSGKCCYCEKEIEPTYEPVDHYRPKAGASRGPGCSEEFGYWWLAYTWENLVYSCSQCNGTKSIRFPLDHGSVTLDPQVEEPPNGREQPLLIDPMAESGVRHIEFILEVRGTGEFWIPQPRNGSPKGKWTIDCCGLDRDGLLTRYKRHVERNVLPEVQKIKVAITDAHTRPKALLREFKRVGTMLLNPEQQFVALSYDALVHYTAKELAPFRHFWPMPT